MVSDQININNGNCHLQAGARALFYRGHREIAEFAIKIFM